MIFFLSVAGCYFYRWHEVTTDRWLCGRWTHGIPKEGNDLLFMLSAWLINASSWTLKELTVIFPSQISSIIYPPIIVVSWISLLYDDPIFDILPKKHHFSSLQKLFPIPSCAGLPEGNGNPNRNQMDWWMWRWIPLMIDESLMIIKGNDEP